MYLFSVSVFLHLLSKGLEGKGSIWRVKQEGQTRAYRRVKPGYEMGLGSNWELLWFFLFLILLLSFFF